LDKEPGNIRFRLSVNAAGTLDSVTTVSSTVSARQEALCRQALWAARFWSVEPSPGRAIGYYTFNFTMP
jgi:TonB family protein